MQVTFRVGVLFLCGAAFLLAQEPSNTLQEEGPKLFAIRCAPCHGDTAHGTDRGPALSGNRRLRSRTVEQLAEFIRKGVPTEGMPGFDLPPAPLNAIANFVHSLNAPASQMRVAGNAAAGERIFFDDGTCAACHLVRGRGSPLGPDLSDIGQTATVDELQDSLVHPAARVTPGYDLIEIVLKDGQTRKGFARKQTSYEVVLQDLEGQFEFINADQIKTLHKLAPLMKPYLGNTQDLIAFLSRLTGVEARPASAAAPPALPEASAGISFRKILEPSPGDWLTYNGNLSGNRFSPLKQIQRENVSRLQLKWMFPVAQTGLESTPLVADGTMYITGSSEAFALDALSGQEIWHYSRPATPGLVGDASLGTNRGVAILGNKLFMVTDNAHLVALNRTTGRPVWEVIMPEEPQHYGSTIAPLVVNDTVIAGVSGGDWGMRGFIACFSAANGELRWRRWTIPAKGDPAAATWKEKEPKFGGGSTWLTGSYDPPTNTLYWTTGNPWPDSDDHERSGDNLFTDSVLALNASTGDMKWHYQFTPHDVHDWDANEPIVLTDAEFHGQKRHLLLQANRNGFFYVFDRMDGTLLSASKFIDRLNWASRIGPDGRPELLSLAKSATSCPSSATNWMSTAYNPATRLYYVVAQEDCNVNTSKGSWKAQTAVKEPGEKYLRALDIETGKTVWSRPELGPVEGKRWAGVLGTEAGLLFHGSASGEFVASDERDGSALWHFSTNATIKASPMTFAIYGKQFIAIAAGSSVLCFGLP